MGLLVSGNFSSDLRFGRRDNQPARGERKAEADDQRDRDWQFVHVAKTRQSALSFSLIVHLKRWRVSWLIFPQARGADSRQPPTRTAAHPPQAKEELENTRQAALSAQVVLPRHARGNAGGLME
ncbi:hypothetical protein [Tianweitania sediminis]|uniref:Uncharacterized protein n=1 Tax=Tianweitania sediminis TaxID=1502156 RepID=A0A8J7R0K5_9HYPH|nr:hypothetical protein [Tianweitania sediminis]MBP0439715.1 hypothetical protein [Tianweitania sediminis]